MTQPNQRKLHDDQLSPSEPVPSLTSGQSILSAHPTLDKDRIEEPPMAQDITTDIESVVSALPAGVSPEEKKRIVKDFAQAIAEKFRNQQLRFLESPVPQRRAIQVFESKLRRYSKVLIEGTPQTVEFTRRRNAVKTVFWHRAEIVDDFVRITFPIHEQETQQQRTVWTNATIQVFEERVDTVDFGEDCGSNTNEFWPVPADMPHNRATEKLDDGTETHPDMEFEPAGDDRDPAITRDYEMIRDYLTTHDGFGVLKSELEKVARHYYIDTMKSIQTSILAILEPSTTCFKAKFQAKWDIREFIQEQYGSEPQDIRQFLAITGNCHDAQMTTVGCYFEQTWPANPSALIGELQRAILGSCNDKQKEKSMIPRCTLTLE